MSSASSRRVLRRLAWLFSLLALAGAVATCSTPARWRVAEQKRWKLTYVRLNDLQQTAATRASSGGRVPAPAPAVDGWGRPIIYRYAQGFVDGRESGGFVLVSSGADGELEPVTQALLATPPDRADLFAARGLAVQQESMAHALAMRDAPWYERTRADLVIGSFSHGLLLDEGLSVPPDIRRRGLLLYGIPTLFLVLCALLLFRASRNRPGSPPASPIDTKSSEGRT